MSEATHCPTCSKQLPDDALINFCPYCGFHLVEEKEEPVEPAKSESEFSETGRMIDVTISESEDHFGEEEQKRADFGVPWEDGADLSFFDRLTHTWSESIFKSREFFQNMPIRAQIGAAVAYAFIFKFLGSILGNFWAKKQLDSMLDQLEEMPVIFRQFFDFYKQNQSDSYVIEQLILGPIFVLLSIFIIPLIFHITLSLFGIAKNGFATTFRVTCYSESAAIFQAIPFIGGIVYFILWCRMLIIGWSEAHGTTVGRAALGLAFPILTCCAIFILIMSFFGMIASSV